MADSRVILLSHLLEEESSHGGLQELGDTGGGGVGAVSGSKGIVHIEVGVGRQLLGKLRIVLLLLRVEAHVLDQDNSTLGEGSHGLGHLVTNAVLGLLDLS